MFSETASLGGLAIQMCYFRGIDEFHATPWLTNSRALVGRMREVACISGSTQITHVLRHAVAEASKGRVNALVYIGDAMEESPSMLTELSGKLAVLGVPAFVFQEGDEPNAQRSFRQMAQLTRGAYMSFDAASARALRDLLKAVAVYAAGGRRALAEYAKRSGGDLLHFNSATEIERAQEITRYRPRSRAAPAAWTGAGCSLHRTRSYRPERCAMRRWARWCCWASSSAISGRACLDVPVWCADHLAGSRVVRARLPRG